jgi:hypothetical protein
LPSDGSPTRWITPGRRYARSGAAAGARVVPCGDCGAGG